MYFSAICGNMEVSSVSIIMSTGRGWGERHSFVPVPVSTFKSAHMNPCVCVCVCAHIYIIPQSLHSQSTDQTKANRVMDIGYSRLQ